ncbi:MAG: AAA family ATPase [Pyrinomonadaceae bacterium]
MKIRKLQLKNIGVFDDETIEFQPCPVKDKAEIHIFTGQNGSGKTTLLMALGSAFDGNPLPSLKNSLYKRMKRINEVEGDDEIKNQIYVLFENEVFSNIEISKKANFVNSVDVLNRTSRSDFVSLHSSLAEYKHQFLLTTSSPNPLTFAVFALSGYRHIENEPVQANYLPKEFNPLSQSLEFIKDYRKDGEITINQLVTNNISNRALSKEDKSFIEAEKYDAVINAIESFIKDVTDYEVKFVLKRSPNELKLRIHNKELDFDVLPDGLRSLISWVADLLGRVDLLKWQDDLPITDKNLILLLDEIEVHLHPAWQRRVLPVVQKLFKNSQIFVSTHSPFVVNSIDNAWVYELKVENGKAKVAEKSLTKTAYSYQTVLREVFDIDERFGEGTEKKGTQFQLDEFYKQRDKILKTNGKSRISKKKFLEFAENLASQSAELQSLVFLELARLSKEKGEPYEI